MPCHTLVTQNSLPAKLLAHPLLQNTMQKIIGFVLLHNYYSKESYFRNQGSAGSSAAECSERGKEERIERGKRMRTRGEGTLEFTDGIPERDDIFCYIYGDFYTIVQ